MADFHVVVSLVLNWVLFLSLFPLAFIWLRRAFRILFLKDFSEVALRRGEPAPNPEKYAPYTAAINLVAGAILVYVIFGVVVTAMPFATWTAIAGSTLWSKLFLDFALSRQAHWQAKPRSAGQRQRPSQTV